MIYTNYCHIFFTQKLKRMVDSKVSDVETESA